MAPRSVAFGSAALAATLLASPARAQEQERAAPAAPPPATTTSAPPSPPPAAEPPATPPEAPSPPAEEPRSDPEGFTPEPLSPESSLRYRPFEIDFLADGGIIALSGSFALLAELVISTGELKPQQPVDPGRLLAIDRGAVKEEFDPGASAASNAGLYGALAFALVDPILSGVREDRHAAVNDAFLYAQSIAITTAATNLAKLSVRRPRPTAYAQQQRLREEFGDEAPDISSTDSALSFFSGHSSIVAAVSATAGYLAFARARHTIRPWLTMAAGTLLTTFVAWQRVESGAHFPTDVIAGALAGGTVGIIVPHIHRTKTTRPMHLGVTQRREGGAEIYLGGTF